MENIFDTLKTLPDFVYNIILILLAIAVGLIIKFILRKILLFNYKRTGYYIFDSIHRQLGGVASIMLPVLMLNIAVPLMVISRENKGRVDHFMQILLTVAFAALFIRAIKVMEEIIYHVYDVNQSNNLKARRIRTQMQFVRQILVAIIVLLGVAVILLSFDNLRKLGTGLLGGVAIGATIVGFAAQQSLGNLLAGFQIAFTQPIRLDDVLVVEGEWGRVEEITLTYVVLKIWDQRRLILPINYFITKPFQNWTRTSSEILGTVFIYMDYSVPVDELRNKLTELLNSSNLWDKKVNVLQVTDTRERTVEIRALMSARNSGEAFDLRCYVRENLIKYIESNYPYALPRTRGNLQLNKDDDSQLPAVTM